MTIIIKPTQDQSDRRPDSQFPDVTVAHPEDELSIEQALELWKSAMAAFGYSQDNLERIQFNTKPE